MYDQIFKRLITFNTLDIAEVLSYQKLYRRRHRNLIQFGQLADSCRSIIVSAPSEFFEADCSAL